MAAVRVIRFFRRLLDVDDTAIAVGKTTQVRAGVGSEPIFVHEYVDFPAAVGELEDLTDVVFTGLADGDRIAYDQGTDTWVNTSAAPVGPHGSSHENAGTDEIDLTGLDGIPTELANHLADATDAHDASAISIVDAAGDFTATEVEGALAELQSDAEADAQALADHLADATDAHDASAISFVAGGTIAATDAQAAIAEVATDAASALATHEADTTNIHGIADTSALALTANHPTNATFNDHSARHENGGLDEISIAGLDGTSTELANHLADATDAHDASAISVVSTTLSGTGTDVQAVFEEIDDLLDDHSSRHENGGADEINVAGLSGELADAQPVTVRKNTGADVGTRSRLNFIEGSNITLTVADDAGSDEVDITVESTAAGGADADDVNLILHMEVYA